MMNSMNPMNHMVPHYSTYNEMVPSQSGPGPGSPSSDFRTTAGPNGSMFPIDHPQQQQQQQQRSMMGLGSSTHMAGGQVLTNSSILNGPMMNSYGFMGSAMNPSHADNAMRSCAGCGGKILERFLLHALERFWHHGCLKCSCCGARLAELGSSCFAKGGMILCKADYVRLFGSSGACSACGQGIPASEFVMRVGNGTSSVQNGHGPPGSQQQQHQHQQAVYHVKCFACTKCQAQLMPGDRYAIIGGSLFCEQDCHKLMKNSNNNSNSANNNHSNNNPNGAAGPVRKGKVGRPRRSRD